MKRLSRALVFALVLNLVLGAMPPALASAECGWSDADSDGNIWAYAQEVCPDACTSTALSSTFTSVVGHQDGVSGNRVNHTSFQIPNSIKVNGSTRVVSAVGRCGTYPAHGGAFNNFPNLTSVNIPISVLTIGNSAFSYCKQLTTVTGGKSVKVIGQTAFQGCTALTSFTVPSSVTTLGKAVFSDCTALKTIYLPTSVTSVGESLCYRCGTVTVYYAGTSAQWANVSVGADNSNLNVICQGDNSGSGGSGGGCNCKTDYAGYYVVKGTDGRLAINSGHGSSASGFTQLGTIPEGTKIYISKASGYYGRGKSSGHWGHVTYNGVSGLCAMNYLEYIGGDVTSPTIYSTGSGIPDVSGFEVFCRAYDDVGISRVQCAVWTSAGGEDDLRSDWRTSAAAAATVDDSLATYRVSYSDHNDEHGEYLIDFYVYDAVGNCGYQRLVVNVDNEGPTITEARVINLTKDGYDVEFTATDSGGSRTQEVRVATWTDKGGEGAMLCDAQLFTPTTTVEGLLHVPAQSNWLNTGYHTSVYGVDALGNIGPSYALDAYVDAVAPEISSVKISDKTGTGFKVTVKATDDHDLSKVILSSWTPDNDDAERSHNGKDLVVNYEAEASGTSGTYTFKVKTADHNDETYTSYCVTAVAVDACGNESAVSSTQKCFLTPDYSQLKLPTGLKTIEAQAFMGTSAEFVVLPSGCKTICSKSFGNSPSLKLIYIPASVTTISTEAFSGSDNVVILARIGSFAHTYALENGIPWIQKDK